MVKPDQKSKPKQIAITPAAAKAALVAGVKPVALLTRVGPHDKPLPKPAFELTDKKLDPAAAAKKPPAKARVRRVKAGRAATKSAVAKASASGRGSAGRAAAQNLARTVPPVATPAIPKPSPAIAKQPTNVSPNQ